MDKKELLKSLKELLNKVELVEETKYFKNRQHEIADVIEDKCMNKLQYSLITKATLLISKDYMYELCLACDELIKNGDLIETPFAQLKVVTSIDSSKTLEIIADR